MDSMKRLGTGSRRYIGRPRFKSDAQMLNKLSGQVNALIWSQDGQLDQILDKQLQTKDYVVKGQEELGELRVGTRHR